MMETKVCSKCGEELPATSEYFDRRKASKDGLVTQCKKCRAKYMKYYRKKNNEQLKERKKKYYEENKEQIQEYWKKHYEENKKRILIYHKAHYQKNKEKIMANQKAYRTINKEYFQRYKKEWQLNNSEKKRNAEGRRRTLKSKLPSTLTTGQWESTKQHFRNCCAYCGSTLHLEQEHFIPLSKGGGYTKENIIPACRSCNASKNNKDFFEWYPQQEFYSEERELFIIEHLISQQEAQQQTA